MRTTNCIYPKPLCKAYQDQLPIYWPLQHSYWYKLKFVCLTNAIYKCRLLTIPSADPLINQDWLKRSCHHVYFPEKQTLQWEYALPDNNNELRVNEKCCYVENPTGNTSITANKHATYTCWKQDHSAVINFAILSETVWIVRSVRKRLQFELNSLHFH